MDLSGDEEDVYVDNLEDEYHEDSLPDLVLDLGDQQHAFDGGGDDGVHRQVCRSVSSSLDLLINNNNETERKISVGSLADLGSPEVNPDWSYDQEYVGTSQQIITEVSTSNKGVFKISYVDHSKAYVPRVSASEKYRSYLSLMPDDMISDESDNIPTKEVSIQILNEFRALSYEDQAKQRLSWAKELEKTEDEILVLKERLAFKTAWCGVLRRNLGISNWSRKLSVNLENWSESFQSALEATEQKFLSSESLQKAKDSFEILVNEVKERMKLGKDELTKKFRSKDEVQPKLHVRIQEEKSESQCMQKSPHDDTEDRNLDIPKTNLGLKNPKDAQDPS